MLIDAEKANYPVAWMCWILRVPRSSFYDWRVRSMQVSATAARREALGVAVRGVFDEFRQVCGCRRIARELNDCGTVCSVGLVADLMREQGLAAVGPRAYRVTTVRDAASSYSDDLIGRDFTATAPGLRLAIDALAMARDHGHLTRGASFHTDRGTQYGADDFVVWCTTNNVKRSMGRTGVCWDNAAAESLFATLKNEMYHRYRLDTRARARFAVAEYIELFSDRRRKHSTLGYRTPAQALNDNQQQAAIAA